MTDACTHFWSHPSLTGERECLWCGGKKMATEAQMRTFAALIDGIANAAPRAARQSAMAGARRRRYQKRTKKEEGA